MTAATSEPRRKRGGQPGNRNRLSHGRFSRAWCARTAEIDAMLLRAARLITRAHMVVRMRKALKRKQKQ